MIVDAPLTDNITKIRATEDPKEIINKIKETEYSEDQTFGFEIYNETAQSVSGRLIISSPTRIQSYNPDIGSLVTEDVVQTTAIPFRLDFKNNFLEVFSNKDDTKEVINRLSQMTRTITTSEWSLNLNEFYKNLTEEDYEINITGIRINNFSLKKNTNGNCYLNVTDRKTAEQILEDYSSDISLISTEITTEMGETVTIGFYRSGTIRVHSQTIQGEYLIGNIKKIFTNLGDS